MCSHVSTHTNSTKILGTGTVLKISVSKSLSLHFLFLTTTTVNAQKHKNNTYRQEKEVATQCQTLRHAEDIEDKKVTFICMVATPVTSVEVCTLHNVGLINHTHQHTHAGTQDVSKSSAGVVVRIIEKEERKGTVNSARPGTVT